VLETLGHLVLRAWFGQIGDEVVLGVQSRKLYEQIADVDFIPR
jgi:hypothetical protein